MTADVKKTYHAVRVSEQDQYTHRFLWRDMDISRDPDTYIVTSISFRDRPSENIATMALLKTAKMKEKEYPHAASMILNNTYVDDIVNTVKD